MFAKKKTKYLRAGNDLEDVFEINAANKWQMSDFWSFLIYISPSNYFLFDKTPNFTLGSFRSLLM